MGFSRERGSAEVGDGGESGACLTYNLQQWIRLRKLQAASAPG